ncbi:MAG: hypothetical protein WCO23_02540 [bacterium]
MPGQGGMFAETVIMLIGGNGKIIETECTSSESGAKKLWKKFKEKAHDRTTRGRVTAACRYNKYTVADLVQLVWNDSPEQRVAKTDEISGEVPIDSIDLIKIVSDGYHDYGQILEFVWQNAPEAVADSLLAAREIENANIWQRFDGLITRISVARHPDGPIAETAKCICNLYYSKLPEPPEPDEKMKAALARTTG